MVVVRRKQIPRRVARHLSTSSQTQHDHSAHCAGQTMLHTPTFSRTKRTKLMGQWSRLTTVIRDIVSKHNSGQVGKISLGKKSAIPSLSMMRDTTADVGYPWDLDPARDRRCLSDLFSIRSVWMDLEKHTSIRKAGHLSLSHRCVDDNHKHPQFHRSQESLFLRASCLSFLFLRQCQTVRSPLS